MFFRIIQTHLLAAIKYPRMWKIKPFDYILVFLTAFFEYILLSYKNFDFDNEIFISILLILFSVYGIIGYALTYLSIKKGLTNNKELRKERKIHIINITVLIIILTFYLINFHKEINAFVHINYITSILLIVSIFLSMKLSSHKF